MSQVCSCLRATRKRIHIYRALYELLDVYVMYIRESMYTRIGMLTCAR